MVSNTISLLLGVAIVIVAVNSCDSLLRMPNLFLQSPSATKYRLVGLIKNSFCFLKSMYSSHRLITRRRRRSCPSSTAYLYPHKTIEDYTCAEKAGVELSIRWTGYHTLEKGWEMPHQLWLIETLPQLSQTKQDTTRWLPELCTTKKHIT